MKKLILYSLSLVLCFLNLYSQDNIHWESIVSAEFLWRYTPGDASVPQDWKTKDFDDSGWLEGPGGIGYSDYDDATTIDPTTTLYIRHDFLISDVTEILILNLYLDYDDGFVAYLNGEEIARANMNNAGLNPSYDQFTDDCEHNANIPEGGIPNLFLLSDSLIDNLLTDGLNNLSIEIHNCSSTSSDLSSSTWLIASIDSPDNNYSPIPAWFVEPPDGKSHLPLIVIETSQNIPDEPKINAFMKVIDNGAGMINHINDTGTDYSGVVGIETRGQSSQYFFPKDSYTIETRDSLGEDLKASLLGMPTESDWVLHAPYSDKTLMRNALTYYFGREMDSWAPRFEYCEVYLNGDYKGVYLLMEKIKRDGDRVDIEKTYPTHNSGDSLTGGYIIRVDKLDGLTVWEDYFYTSPKYSYPNSRVYDFTYYYPEADKITLDQKNYIQSFMYNAESALNSPDFKDPVKGYSNFIDPNSFADFQIMNELGSNVDGYRYSTYFHKDADSKDNRLHAGPLWDFNLCYGNVNYYSRELTDNWLYQTYGTNEETAMHWWARLMEDENYSAILKTRYSIFRNTILSNEMVFGFIDETAAYLGEAIDRNFVRWPILGQYIWPNNFVGNTYAEEINYLKSWMADRFAFLDANWYYDVVSVEENSLNSTGKIRVYPNPFSENIALEFSDTDTDLHQLIIYDLTGKIVSEGSVGNNETLSLSFLEKGIYILRVSLGNNIWHTQKLIKQ